MVLTPLLFPRLQSSSYSTFIRLYYRLYPIRHVSAQGNTQKAINLPSSPSAVQNDFASRSGLMMASTCFNIFLTDTSGRTVISLIFLPKAFAMGKDISVSTGPGLRLSKAAHERCGIRNSPDRRDDQVLVLVLNSTHKMIDSSFARSVCSSRYTVNQLRRRSTRRSDNNEFPGTCSFT